MQATPRAPARALQIPSSKKAKAHSRSVECDPEVVLSRRARSRGPSSLWPRSMRYPGSTRQGELFEQFPCGALLVASCESLDVELECLRAYCSTITVNFEVR